MTLPERIAPVSVATLCATDPAGALIDAAAATFKRLITGVHVASHPGKVDIADIVASETMALPAIRIGFTRMRATSEAAAHHGLMLDVIAYIVTGELTDLSEKRRVNREVVARAIGARMIDILIDDTLSAWGLEAVTPPSRTPGPEFKPVFTSDAYAKGVAWYAVTWSQTLIDLSPSVGGTSPFRLNGEGGEMLAPDIEAEAEIAALFFPGEAA